MKIFLLIIPALLLGNAKTCNVLDYEFVKSAEYAYPESDYDAFSCKYALKSLNVLAKKQEMGCGITKQEDEYAVYTVQNLIKVCQEKK